VNIETVQADITRLAVDAVVNAANESLRRGGGVCGAIFAAAGPHLDEACAAIGHCATGDAVATDGFDLPARFVIHTVGPVWHGGDRDEAARLASCYRRCLEVAGELGVTSVAFPAISTGIFGYPADDAARIAVSTLRELVSRTAVSRTVLVAFDDETAARYRRLLAR
jgi:O-acetyl-ADP-ribose deacetylase (regulator of RNase III)